MEQLLTSSLIIIIIFILLKINSYTNIKENFTEHSSSPGPSNSSSPGPSNSSPVISSSDSNEDVLENELKNNLQNIVKEILGHNGELGFMRRMNNIMLILEGTNYRNISKEKIENAENLIRDYFHNHLKDLYIINKKEVYNVTKDRINIIMFPGSNNIIIQVLPKNHNDMTLTDEEKELLEYHNFRRVFIQRLEPITEFEFKKIKQAMLNKIKN